jgi:peptide deformylase
MAILHILQHPDEQLRKKALDVKDFGDSTQRIIDDLFQTLYETGRGIGLAATQVNIQQRIVVIDMSGPEKMQPFCLINPLIIDQGKEMCEELEGCLSVPGVSELVKRPKHVKVSAYNREGQPINIDDDTYFARCIQHEMDHLDGILFIDRLSPLKRKRALEKLKKIKEL